MAAENRLLLTLPQSGWNFLANNDYPYQFIMENMQIKIYNRCTALQSSCASLYFWKFIIYQNGSTTSKKEEYL
jgi:hypothetical protein